jgi:hypothetical protein
MRQLFFIFGRHRYYFLSTEFLMNNQTCSCPTTTVTVEQIWAVLSLQILNTILHAMTPIIIAFANLIFRIKKSDCFGSEIEVSSPKDSPPKGLQ